MRNTLFIILFSLIVLACSEKPPAEPVTTVKPAVAAQKSIEAIADEVGLSRSDAEAILNDGRYAQVVRQEQQAWLEKEARRGRLPHLRVGARFLFSPQAVETALARRASVEFPVPGNSGRQVIGGADE